MNDDHQTQLRRKWVVYWREVKQTREAGYSSYPPFPPELNDLICGAKTRAGMPCKMNLLYQSGRCKFHGGMSTGPKSAAGKARSALNGKPHCQLEPHEDLRKPDVESALTGEKVLHLHDPACGAAVSSRAGTQMADDVDAAALVRCVDCVHMSAAHTCLLQAAKGRPMGAKRLCPEFVEAVAWD